MGKVRNETIKKFARSIIEKYPERFTKDFESNKKLLDEVADIQSKKLRNQIAGYVTSLISRIPFEIKEEPSEEGAPPQKVKERRISKKES